MHIIGYIHAFDEKLAVVERHYGHGTARYDCLSEQGEPYGTLTKVVPGVQLADGEVLIKTYSENEPFRQPLLESGLFEDTGRRVNSGYINLEVWRRTH